MEERDLAADQPRHPVGISNALKHTATNGFFFPTPGFPGYGVALPHFNRQLKVFLRNRLLRLVIHKKLQQIKCAICWDI